MSNPPELYTLGVDYGTESGRAVVVRVSDGLELASAVTSYPHGVIDHHLPTGEVLPPDWALQHPDDYLEVLRKAVPQAVQLSGVNPEHIVGIGIDFTACTMLPTTRDGTPLCFLPELKAEKHAFVKLWKHHAAQSHADRINAVAARMGEKWLPRYGFKISSEWFFAKALQILEEAPEVYQAADRLIEAADWVVWQLTGAESRNTCTAGYKAMYQDGQFPSRDYFAALNADFADVVEEKMLTELSPLGGKAGTLSARAAELTGLKAGIAVAVANVDAHVAVPAATVTEAGQMVAIMGTSTCHMLLGEKLREVPGMCGVVEGGIIPGLYGYEAGQSGVGDIFGWFVKHAVPESYVQQAAAENVSVHHIMEREASLQRPGEHGLIALDWLNGNRSNLVDANLSGLILGLTLHTRAPDIYRALIEATAYGTRAIIENFRAHGVPVTELIIAGGLKKNKMLMQIYSDVTGLPLSIVASEQGPALGSAIHAAVAAGIYPDIRAAAKTMGKLQKNVYTPIPGNVKVYQELYQEYIQLHDHFGRGLNNVMKRLKKIAQTEPEEVKHAAATPA
ncbi:ribulokinase [Deinococcus roseus]|uniref:Ribulokinase n=1 Tax=Deinococcus roseus TaxID=392414 RepID=A0ABQ2D0V1_9DEIO|nr:ribulokinase [Deinococcus roseus]GGJ35440.1 ribulokinase [Deinococcus roseus]